MTLPIIKYRNIWFVFSGLLVAASVAALFMFPLKFGIDFTGGSLVELEFAQDRPDSAAVAAALDELRFEESVVQPVGDEGMLIRLPSMDEPKHQELSAEFRERFGDVRELRFESIGPTVGEELRTRAIWSVSLVLIAIALYVAYAFRKVSRPVASWKYGVTTLIVGLFHDVLLPVAAFAVFGSIARAEVNSSFIAAILTVLGFSVHDTIVVFDRVRENLLKVGGSFEEIVEKSVNDTLSRSINTSLTTVLPLVSIFIWGGESLKYFAFALIIGVIAGTYSSIFLAAPLLIVFEKKSVR